MIVRRNLVLLVLLAGCGGRAVEVRTEQSVPVTVAPPTTTTTLTVPETTTTVAKEPPMPDGAHHGDQKEVVDRFARIDGTADCDALRAERAADLNDRDGMLTVADGWHRSRAELDERYAEAAHHRMTETGCYTIAGTE